MGSMRWHQLQWLQNLRCTLHVQVLQRLLLAMRVKWLIDLDSSLRVHSNCITSSHVVTPLAQLSVELLTQESGR